jgi:hypothetical protein
MTPRLTAAERDRLHRLAHARARELRAEAIDAMWSAAARGLSRLVRAPLALLRPAPRVKLG